MNEQQEPLLVKEWQQLLDLFLTTERIDSELYDRCDEAQVWLINEVKKSINRIKNKS